MKKIFGLLAVCALVACNDSSENVAGPQQWGNQNGQQQGQLNQDSLAAAIADSIARAQQQQQQQQGQDQPFSSTGFNTVSSSSFTAVPASSSAALPASSAAVPASSAAVPKSSAATPKSSAVVVEDDGKIHMTTAWDGTEPHVPVGNNDGGWWYDYNDNEQGAASVLTWEAEPATGGDMTPVIEACGPGICGSFALEQADYEYDPFVGFAFGFGKNNKYAADGTAMKGICVKYKSTAPIVVELGLTASTESTIGYANPAATIAKSTSLTVEDLAWSSFEQPDWVSAKQTIATTTAVKELSSIKFKITSKTDISGTFAVTQVGPFGTCE